MTISNITQRRPAKVFDTYLPGSTKTTDFPPSVLDEYNTGIPIVGIRSTKYQDLKSFPDTVPAFFSRPFEYVSQQAVLVDRDIMAAPLYDRLRNPGSAVQGLVVTGTDIGYESQFPPKNKYEGDALGLSTDPKNQRAPLNLDVDYTRGGAIGKKNS